MALYHQPGWHPVIRPANSSSMPAVWCGAGRQCGHGDRASASYAGISGSSDGRWSCGHTPMHDLSASNQKQLFTCLKNYQTQRCYLSKLRLMRDLFKGKSFYFLNRYAMFHCEGGMEGLCHHLRWAMTLRHTPELLCYLGVCGTE